MNLTQTILTRPGRRRGPPSTTAHVPLAGVIVCVLVATACSAGDGGGTTEEGATVTPTTAAPATTAAPTTTTAADSADPLIGRGEVELIKDGYQFTEGPQWMRDAGVLLFTDVTSVIYQLAADDQITPYRKPSDQANGLAVDPEGRLLAAERATRRVTRTESDGTVTPIAERFEGALLNQPNDIAVRSDGTIYFTDPLYGDYRPELDFRGVFRIAPDGSLTAERRGATTEQPNGIALSPDESLLYVANWADDLVWAFDVAADGSLSEARSFVATAGGPDGMAVDTAGNLFVTTASGIEIFAPDGTLWGNVPPPRTPANVAFGGADGRTLYITAEDSLFRVTLAHPGPY
jgi:gluconolactonase